MSNISFIGPRQEYEYKAGCNPPFHDVRSVKEAVALQRQGYAMDSRNSREESPLVARTREFLKNPEKKDLKKLIEYFVINDPDVDKDLTHHQLLNEILETYLNEDNRSKFLSDYVDMACFFIRHGADPNHCERWVVKKVINRISNIENKDQYWHYSYLYETLCQSRDIEALCNPPFHDVNSLEEAQELFKQGCKIRGHNRAGETVLQALTSKFLEDPLDQKIQEIMKFVMVHDSDFKQDPINLVLLNKILSVWIDKIRGPSLKKGFDPEWRNRAKLAKTFSIKYFDMACQFIENGIDPNKCNKVTLEIVEEKLEVSLQKDKIYFSLYKRLLNSAIILKSQISTFQGVLEAMVRDVDNYKNYQDINKILIQKGAQLKQCDPIFHNSLFHAAINQLYGCSSQKELTNRASILNYLIDLNGGYTRVLITNNLVIKGKNKGGLSCEETIKTGDYGVVLQNRAVCFHSDKNFFNTLYTNTIKSALDLKDNPGSKAHYFDKEADIELFSVLVKRVKRSCMNEVVKWKYMFNVRLISNSI